MSLYLDMAVDLYTHYTYWKFLPGAFPAWEISCSKTGTEGYQPFFQLRRIRVERTVHTLSIAIAYLFTLGSC